MADIGFIRTRSVGTLSTYRTYGYWQGYYGRYPSSDDTISTNQTYKDLYLADIDRFNAASLEDLANQPKAIVNREFGVLESLASSHLDIARGYMDSIGDTALGFDIPETDDPINDVELPNLTPMDFSSVPEFTPFTGTLDAITGLSATMGALQDVPDIDNVDITVEDIAFTENQIDSPYFTTHTAPEDIQTNTIDLPVIQDISMPDSPVFADLVFPDQPTLVDKQFDIVAPAMPDDLTEPATLSYTEGNYSSDIKVALFQKILADITDGGTGLSVSVEEDIYDRGRERQRVENERLYTETVSNFSGSGWELPTGVYASAITEIQKEISRKVDQNNREITISQADLEQKNIQFSVGQATQLESALMEFFNYQQNRTLDAAKTTATMGVEILNSLIAKYNAKLKKYETEAAALGEWIRFESIKAENYKTQMAGVKIASDIQDSKAGVYEKQLRAIETIKSMYQIDMEGAKIQSEIEKDKLVQLKTKTDIYLGKLSGEKTKADTYLTMTEAEKTRAGITSERVRANALRLEGAKAKADIQAQQAENILKQNQLTLEKYKADLEQRRADIADELKSSDLNVKGFNTSTTSYNEQLRAAEIAYSTRVKELDNQIQASKVRLEKAVAITESTVNGYVALKGLVQKGNEGVLNVAAQIGASALAALNVSASISDNTSRRTEETWTTELSIDSTPAV